MHTEGCRIIYSNHMLKATLKLLTHLATYYDSNVRQYTCTKAIGLRIKERKLTTNVCTTFCRSFCNTRRQAHNHNKDC